MLKSSSFDLKCVSLEAFRLIGSSSAELSVLLADFKSAEDWRPP